MTTAVLPDSISSDFYTQGTRDVRLKLSQAKGTSPPVFLEEQPVTSEEHTGPVQYQGGYDVRFKSHRSGANGMWWQEVFSEEHTEPPIQYHWPQFAVSIVSDTPESVPTLLQYGQFVIVDFNEPLEEFFLDYQGAVSYLQKNGRPVAARQLLDILVDQEPEDEPIRITSLREMAWLLVDEPDFADPFIGADRRGLMHAQWRIAGNGVIVWGFFERGENLLVIRADKVPSRPALKVSTRSTKTKILDQYGNLVPRRPQ